MIIFSKISSPFIGTSLCLGMLITAAPASAATISPSVYEELRTTLDTVHSVLLVLQKQIDGKVLGATTVVVSNDLELATALKNATGGDTIQLNPGVYGKIFIREDQYNKLTVGAVTNLKRSGTLSSPVIITSKDPANRAVMTNIKLVGSPFWRIEGLSFRPAAGPSVKAIEVSADNVVITRNDITYGDSTNWTADEWNATAGNGIDVQGGNNVEVSYNNLKNVSFGIGIGFNAPNAHVIGNIVDTFNGDGMRGLGDNGLFEQNLITNAVQTDSNHSDGFQSWRNYTNNNRPVERVVLRNNTFLGLQQHRLSSKMQGIGMFDGPFSNWTIENNLLVLDTYHGISIYGAFDSKVRNNVVVDVNNTKPGPAWIRIGNTKTGTTSVNTVVENNISTKIITDSVGVTYTANTVVTTAEYDTYFIDHKNKNWDLKAGALPVSVGRTVNATAPSPVITTPAVPAPAIAPTVSFSTDKASVTNGQVFTLTWNATNASTCTAGNGWSGAKPISGSETFTAVAPATYLLTCTGSGGSIEKSLSIVISTQNITLTPTTNSTPTPSQTNTSPAIATATLSFRVDKSSIKSGQAVVLTWSTTNATSCTASGGWSGSKGINTQETILPKTTTTYKLTCTGSSGSIKKSVTVTVSSVTSSSETSQPTQRKVVTTDRVNVRLNPAKDILGIQEKGATGKVISENTITVEGRTWIKVDFNTGVDGYVATAYIQTASGIQTPSGMLSREQTLKLIADLLKQIEVLQKRLQTLKS